MLKSREAMLLCFFCADDIGRPYRFGGGFDVVIVGTGV